MNTKLDEPSEVAYKFSEYILNKYGIQFSSEDINFLDDLVYEFSEFEDDDPEEDDLWDNPEGNDDWYDEELDYDDEDEW